MTASISFSDYVASQEARENIALAVLGHTYALCEALRQNYIDQAIRGHQYYINRGDSVDYHNSCITDLKSGTSPINFIVETGKKYHKILLVNTGGSRSVHAFIDKKTGEVYKPSSFKSPAKGVRYDLRIIEEREWLMQNADWSGSYLYKR